MNLTGKTTVVGIFGDPVAHSLSPQMQNAALRACGLDAVYVPFHVTPAQLCDAVAGIRALGLRGVNLTIPHKEAVCALLDELDEEAAQIGAVNTIVNHDGWLVGHNTDGVGLLKAITQGLGVDVRDKRVLLLGAGGACRAAAVTLARTGVAWLGIANRTRPRAKKLVEEVGAMFTGTAFADYPLGAELPGALPEPVDLLVNTTAIGLKGEAFDFDALACVIPSGAVYDMVYRAEPTALVKAALEKSLNADDGLGMLAGQGEAALQHWFGHPPPEDIMEQTLRETVKRWT